MQQKQRSDAELALAKHFWSVDRARTRARDQTLGLDVEDYASEARSAINLVEPTIKAQAFEEVRQEILNHLPRYEASASSHDPYHGGCVSGLQAAVRIIESVAAVARLRAAKDTPHE